MKNFIDKINNFSVTSKKFQVWGFWILLGFGLFSASFTENETLTVVDGWNIETPAPSIAREMIGAADLGLWTSRLSESEKAQMRYFLDNMEAAVLNKINNSIPISITLAQGVLESNKGTSFLARNGNNHFGIKTYDPNVPHIVRCDDTCDDMFRKYRSSKECFNDHGKVLNKPRYRKLHTYQSTDYKNWAWGLKSCGYATDKEYPKKLIRIIKKYNLFVLDEMTDIELSIFIKALKLYDQEKQ